MNGISQSPFTNEHVAVVSCGTTANIWNSTTWNLIRTYTDHALSLWSVEFINADTVATGSADLTVKLWSISTGLTCITIQPETVVYSLKLLSNGFHLAAACDSIIKIYDTDTGILITTLSGHTSTIKNLELISDDLLASSSEDMSVRIWNLTTNASTFILNGHASTVRSLKKVSTDILASGSCDATIILWNITSGTLISILSGHTSCISYSIDLLNDGQTLVSGTHDGTVKFWNISTGELLNTINTGNSLWSFAVTSSSNQGKFILI
jgi:WD40 repeat protein